METVCQFVLSQGYALLKEPFRGDLKVMHHLFVKWSQQEVTFNYFIHQLQLVSSISGALLISSEKLEDIQCEALQILSRKLSGVSPDSGNEQEKKLESTSLLSQLTRELNSYCVTPLEELDRLLNGNSQLNPLIKEQVKRTIIMKPFVETCEDVSHAFALSSIAYVDQLAKKPSIRFDRLKFNSHIAHCIERKAHHLPVIQKQTEQRLGDCSYLDTCHKMTQCRYIHYTQLMPLPWYEKGDSCLLSEEERTHNLNIQECTRIGDVTCGDPIDVNQRSQLPPQWINCDVRKFDFSILGKFGAVMADPAWNIHMNLPYGTCNDSELLSLPMETLQDEGIFILWVTGRSIDLGRECLKKWGYEVRDEMIWVKTNQLTRTICTGRTGHWLNHSKEHLLIGLKGNPSWLKWGLDSDILVSATRETSRKPDEIYEVVERLVGSKSRKLELFGRDHNTRAGWFTIGNQLSGCQIYEKDVKTRYKESLTGRP